MTAGTGSFADKNVGHGKTVTATGFTLTGADASNYTVVQPTNLTANITPAALVVTGNDAQKTAGTVLAFNGTEFKVQGLVGGEQAQTAQLQSSGAGINAPAGSYTIAVSNVTGSAGFDVRNYSVNYVDGHLQVQPQRNVLGAADLWRLFSPQLTQDKNKLQPTPSKPMLTIDPDFIRMAGM